MFNVYFLYPLWLWLIPLVLMPLLAGYSFNHYKKKSKNWDKLVDKSLQPFVISESNEKNKLKRVLFYFIAGLLAILAISGPSLHKESVPLYENHQGLVIVLDLSSSMLAQDVKPSRIQRAKLALVDFLKPPIPLTSSKPSKPSKLGAEKNEKAGYQGYVGLVVFAADAFTVAPLTNDVETIIAQLTHMSPTIMPAQGSRLDKAIAQSVSLLANAGYHKGNILLVTDGLSDIDATKKAARFAKEQGFKVSVLAVGTEEGATIPYRSRQGSNETSISSQVLLNHQGKAVVATLDRDALKSITNRGKGVYLDLNSDQGAITTLLERYQSSTQFMTMKPESDVSGVDGVESQNENIIEYWVNAGIWLLFPLLVMVLYLFRRGLIWALCFMVLLPIDPVHAFDFNGLWLNQQQQAKQLLDKGEAVKAQQLFSDNQWKAIAAYRAKNYPLAVQLFAEQDNTRAWYNKGNALLKMEQLSDAIRAYEVVLEKQPEHADASYNLQLAKRAAEKEKQELLNDNQEAKQEESTALQETELKANSSQRDVQQSVDKADIDRQREQQAFEKQWLKSVPDDPSGLWRRKFKYQYNKRSQQPEAQQW